MIPMELILTVVGGLGGFIMKNIAQNRANQFRLLEMSIKQNQESSKLADAAAKRSSPFVRKVLAFFIIGTIFGGLFIYGFLPDIDVTMIIPKEQKSFLGLFKWGKTYDVISASGFVLPIWIKYVVITICSFVFGTGASKIS